MNQDLANRLKKISASQTLVLTHQGRKSGKSYDVVIWFMVEGDRMFLATSNANRNWVRNVIANPRVKLKAGSENFGGSLRQITDAAERDHVATLTQTKYWYVLPIILAARFLQSIGLVKDNTGAFEVSFDG